MAEVTAPLAARWHPWARARGAVSRPLAATWRRVRAWRLHAAVPGLAGAGLISAAAALRFGLWAGLLAGGLFLLRLDSRL